MPVAGGHIEAGNKYHYQDHDSDVAQVTPPVQNTWYTVIDRDDVRLLWCTISQINDEAAAKDVEVRWTIDGTVYFEAVSLPNITTTFVYRSFQRSNAGVQGLLTTIEPVNAAYYVDKRGHDFKVEVRMTSVPGTNQVLFGIAVPETLEVT